MIQQVDQQAKPSGKNLHSEGDQQKVSSDTPDTSGT